MAHSATRYTGNQHADTKTTVRFSVNWSPFFKVLCSEAANAIEQTRRSQDVLRFALALLLAPHIALFVSLLLDVSSYVSHWRSQSHRSARRNWTTAARLGTRVEGQQEHKYIVAGLTDPKRPATESARGLAKAEWKVPCSVMFPEIYPRN